MHRATTIGLIANVANASPPAGLLWDWADANVDRDNTGYPSGVTEAAVQDPREGAWDWPSETKWATAAQVRELDGDRRPIIVEGYRKNWVTVSEDVSHGNWSKLNSPIITADDDTAPDGESDADLIAFAAGGAGGQLRQTLSGSIGSGAHVWRIWLKQGTPGAGAAVNLYYRNKDASNVLLESVTPGDEWTFYEREVAGGSGGGSPLFGLIEDTDAASFHVWGAELRVASFAGTYVRSFGAVEGMPDDVVMTSADVDAAFFTGTWQCTVTPMWDGSDQDEDPAYVYWIDADNYLAIVGGNTMRLRIGGSNFDRAITPTAGVSNVVDVDFAGGTMSVDEGAGVALTGAWPNGNVRVGSASDGVGGGHLRGVVTIPFA